MPNQTARRLNPIFRALSDPTRRRVVQRLARGPAATKELAAPFDMALPSFLQHLALLQSAGLIRSTKVGRVRTYELAPDRLRDAEQWMQEQLELWTTRLNQLDEYLLTLKQQEQ